MGREAGQSLGIQNRRQVNSRRSAKRPRARGGRHRVWRQPKRIGQGLWRAHVGAARRQNRIKAAATAHQRISSPQARCRQSAQPSRAAPEALSREALEALARAAPRELPHAD